MFNVPRQAFGTSLPIVSSTRDFEFAVALSVLNCSPNRSALRSVYTCDFCCDFQCDFRLLTVVKEWINVLSVCFFTSFKRRKSH